MKKAICILLITSMLVSFLACSGKTGEQSESSDNIGESVITTASPKDTMYYESDSLPTLDFGGETVTILSLERLNPSISFYETEFTVEDLNSNAVNDSIYNRELFVEDRLGVEINNVKVESVTNEIDKVLNSGDDTYDGFVHVNHILSNYIFQDYLTDLYTVDYLDFTKPWWSEKFNSEAEIFGQLYLSTGSLCLSLIKNAYVVFYNKSIANNYAKSIPELADLYGLVDSGEWVFDKFVEIGGGIYEDLNGNSIRDLEDVYGIAYDNYYQIDAIWSGFDLNVFSRTDDGWFEMDVNTDKVFTALEKISDMLYETKGSMSNNVGATPDESYSSDFAELYFANGTNLFFVDRIGYTEKDTIRNMQDDYGILPFPKYDENQKEYYSFPFDFFGSIGIPVSNTNPEIVGAVFEAMASYSYRDTVPAYLDIVLKGQYMSDPESRRMVDIVVDGIMIDAAWIYVHSLSSDYPRQYRYVVGDGDRSFATKHQEYLKKVNTVLKIYKRDFENK